MPQPEKTKMEQLREFLENQENQKLPTAVIAEMFHCNAGTVRRARYPDKDGTIADLVNETGYLREQIEKLEAELKQYRHNMPRPRKPAGDFCPLFDRAEAEQRS